MEPPGERSVLARLERSELDARARRLAAAAQAEWILTDARERAAAIEAQEGERVASSLEQARLQLRSMADAEIDSIGRTEPDPATAPPQDHATRSAAAIELVIAAVLGEASAWQVPGMAGARAVRPARRRRLPGGPPCS